MLEGVAGQSGMVHLDIHLEVLVQIVGLKEADYGLGIHVILMLAGLHGLRLDQECAGESIGACIVACHGQHGG